MSGLSASDTQRLARKAIFDHGAILASDVPVVMRAKYELLNRKGILRYEPDTAHFADVGGLANLKAWLEKRRAAFDGSAPELDAPKGVLLLGVQGCGKSLAARACAGIFNVPLLRLDCGALFDKFVGESERNLRESLATADLLAPCVLWVDEIEKGFASGDTDGGATRRVLGAFLTWLAEKNSRVFVVATANDISALPPELIRKGRFDEIFFVDLPDAGTRAEILRIHATQRGIALDESTLEGARRGLRRIRGSGDRAGRGGNALYGAREKCRARCRATRRRNCRNSPAGSGHGGKGRGAARLGRRPHGTCGLDDGLHRRQMIAADRCATNAQRDSCGLTVLRWNRSASVAAQRTSVEQ